MKNQNKIRNTSRSIHAGQNNQSGIVMTIILIIVALIALKYLLNFDIVVYLKSPGPQKVIQTSWTWLHVAYSWLHTTILHLLGK